MGTRRNTRMRTRRKLSVSIKTSYGEKEGDLSKGIVARVV